MDEQKFLLLPLHLLENVDLLYTFMLLVSRIAAFFVLVPGIGAGQRGMKVRFPAIVMCAAIGVTSSPSAVIPEDWAYALFQLISEVILGASLGFVPFVVLSAAQAAGQLASTTMGLGAGQLMDPTTGTSVSQLGRLFGDVIVLTFLLLNGHHIFLYILMGADGQLQPGTFIITATTVESLTAQSAYIFELSFILAAPVVIALLITQFIMGIVTKMVQQVNIFIVSFPLTIGIGLMVSVIILPGIYKIAVQEVASFEDRAGALIKDSLVPRPE